MMPIEVLETAQAELTDWRGSGMSVMEVSHRGKDFIACAASAEQGIRRLLGVPDDYRVLFLQGGASGQFAAIPMNLTKPGDTAAYLNTGQWSTKAIKSAKTQLLNVDVLADEAETKYTAIPAAGSYVVPSDAAYLHYTPNETINGVEFDYVPETGDVPLVADFSSTIMSRPIDVSQYGLIYAGAQKNLGPAGLAVVIVREDLIGNARSTTPDIWDYTAMANADSMLNTPPTFAVYLLGLVLDWIDASGGLTAMAARNQAKASSLYAAIDSSEFYANPVAVNARSWMNVPFTLADSSLDAEFLAQAQQRGLTNLAGHRAVGGMRASIYNAMPQAGVDALIDFMTDFANQRG